MVEKILTFNGREDVKKIIRFKTGTVKPRIIIFVSTNHDTVNSRL